MKTIQAYWPVHRGSVGGRCSWLGKQQQRRGWVRRSMVGQSRCWESRTFWKECLERSLGGQKTLLIIECTVTFSQWVWMKKYSKYHRLGVTNSLRKVFRLKLGPAYNLKRCWKPATALTGKISFSQLKKVQHAHFEEVSLQLKPLWCMNLKIHPLLLIFF